MPLCISLPLITSDNAATIFPMRFFFSRAREFNATWNEWCVYNMFCFNNKLDLLFVGVVCVICVWIEYMERKNVERARMGMR